MDLDVFDIAISQGIDPGFYHEMQPFIQQVVSSYGPGRNLTVGDISRMTDEVVASGRRRGVPFTGHGGRTLNDVVLLLILLNLYNYGYNMNPFWNFYYGGIPFFLLPFLGVRRPMFVRPVPPIGEVRPPFVRPVPPIGELRPPTGRPGRRRPRR